MVILAGCTQVMKMRDLWKIGLFFILMIGMVSTASALCVLNLDQDSYYAGEDTAVAIMSCSDDNEENRAYAVTWRDATLGTVLETDTGSTPATKGTTFNEDFIISSGFPSGHYLSATLTGLLLEGSDSAPVYSPASVNASLTYPTSEISIYVNESFIMTCVGGNDGGGNISVNITAQYGSGSTISNVSGNLVLNETGVYACGVLGEGETCTKSWNVTGAVKSQNEIQCYVSSSDAYDTSDSQVIDVFQSANDLTISLNSENYAPGETSTARLTSYFESSPYNVIWYNSTGGVICNKSGYTAATSGQIFFASCSIPSNVSYQDNNTAIFFLNGDSRINVTESFYITNVSASAYIVTELIVKYETAFLGYSQSVKGIVKDGAGNEAVGECCRVQIDDAITGAPIYTSDDLVIDGLGSCEVDWILGKEDFEVLRSYAVTIVAWQCSDEDLPSEDRKSGFGETSFDVSEYFTEQDDFIPVVDTDVFSGFDRVELQHHRINNFNQPMEVVQTVWFSNIDTEQDYHYDYLKDITTTVNIGESIVTEKYKIPVDLPSGTYRVEKNIFYLYQGDVKEFKFVKSESFNITELQEVITVNWVSVKDYFGEEITTHSSALDLDEMPESNYTSPYYVLGEGFGYQFCMDITSNYDDVIYFHLQNLVLENPTTGQSFEEFNKQQGVFWQRVALPYGNSSTICFYNNVPLTVETHSDWKLEYDVYMGDVREPFICDDYCSYNGATDYFYIGAVEDVIQFEKWIEEPTNSSVGVPGTFIVTEREEYLTMNDDCEYKSQEEIPWGSANVTCYDKDDNSSKKIDYDVYPIAGEDFRVCFQVRNYLSDEVDMEIFDFYIDSDVSESVIFFDEWSGGYIPSITDEKVYKSATPSRAYELGGNLIDSYGIMCSKWLTLPDEVKGGNSWDIQGNVRIDPTIYNLIENVIWNWESDEFPIYGAREGEDFTRVIDVTNLTTSAYGQNITSCNYINVSMTYDYLHDDEDVFLAEYCFEQTEDDFSMGCFYKILNPDVGTGLTLTDTFRLPFVSISGMAEVYVHIYSYDNQVKGSMFGYADSEPWNSFYLIANKSDACRYTEDLDQEVQYKQATFLERIWTVLLQWFAFVTGGTNVDTAGNYTGVSTSLVTDTVGSSALQVNYNITGNEGTTRSTLHFVYEFAPMTGTLEGAFEDQNPSIKGYQALSYYQAIMLNQTKRYLLTLEPDLSVGNYTMYETIYEVNEVPPTSDGNVLADERVISQKSYSIVVDTVMESPFDGDVIQLEGTNLQLLS